MSQSNQNLTSECSHPGTGSELSVGLPGENKRKKALKTIQPLYLRIGKATIYLIFVFGFRLWAYVHLSVLMQQSLHSAACNACQVEIPFFPIWLDHVCGQFTPKHVCHYVCYMHMEQCISSFKVECHRASVRFLLLPVSLLRTCILHSCCVSGKRSKEHLSMGRRKGKVFKLCKRTKTVTYGHFLVPMCIT